MCALCARLLTIFSRHRTVSLNAMPYLSGLAIMITLFALNLVGDALQDRFNIGRQ